MRSLVAIAATCLAGVAQAQLVPEEAPQGEVIDRAVAWVAGRVITLSELELEARVALVQGGGDQAAFAPLDEAALRDALDLAIGQRLQEREADRLQAYPLEEGELDLAVAAFQGRFKSPADFERFLARHEADRQQLAAVLARGLRTAKILDGKLRLRAQVSEAELKEAFAKSGLDQGSSYEALRAPLRQKLVAEKLKKLTRDELRQARRGGQVRLIAPFARAGKAAAQ